MRTYSAVQTTSAFSLVALLGVFCAFFFFCVFHLRIVPETHWRRHLRIVLETNWRRRLRIVLEPRWRRHLRIASCWRPIGAVIYASC